MVRVCALAGGGGAGGGGAGVNDAGMQTDTLMPGEDSGPLIDEPSRLDEIVSAAVNDAGVMNVF